MLWLILSVCVGFLIVAAQVPGDSLTFDSEPARDFNDNWFLADASGRVSPGQAPLLLPGTIPAQGPVFLTKTVPDGLPQPLVVGFRSAHQQLRLSCDGKVIYTFGYGAQPLFGRSPGSAYHLVRLPQDCAGQQLLLEQDSPYPSYQGRVGSFEFGSKAALLFSLLRDHGFSLLLTVVVLVAGLLMLLVYVFVLRHTAAAGRETFYLGLFSVSMAVWLFGESRLTQFFSIPPAINTTITFLAMLVAPIPLVRYVACGRSPSTRKLLNFAARLLTLLVFLSLFLQLFNLVDFIPQLPYINGSMAVAAVLLLYAVISDALRRPSAETHRLTLSMGVLAFFFLLETIRLYISRGAVGSLMRIGVLSFILIQAYSAVKSSLQMMRMSRLATVDALTGCLNRTAYSHALEELAGHAKTGVVIADINDLKFINDTYGHSAGDDAIIRCSACFTQAFSPLGRCFRIGGDEFAMLGQPLTWEQLHRSQGRFIALVEEESVKTDYPLSVSCGGALREIGKGQSLSETVRQADQVMYSNKRKYKGVFPSTQEK